MCLKRLCGGVSGGEGEEQRHRAEDPEETVQSTQFKQCVGRATPNRRRGSGRAPGGPHLYQKGAQSEAIFQPGAHMLQFLGVRATHPPTHTGFYR